MRYIDTAGRDPDQALGRWLENLVANELRAVSALRFQSGFFGATSLGFLVPVLDRLRGSAGVAHLLVGSNDGATTRSDIETLLQLAGAPRANLRVGVVNFDNAYYHPKTIHIELGRNAAVAYVGSANLTASGTTSLHIEAGVLLDTREGDDAGELRRIAQAVDWWFANNPQGLYEVRTAEDLDALVTGGVLNVPRPVLAPRPPARTRRGQRAPVTLRPLLRMPGLPPGVRVPPPPAVIVATPPGPSPVVVVNGPPATRRRQTPTARYEKPLTTSDAQRKATGNQRGSITLVRANQPIDTQTYFRRELFAGVRWTTGQTRTGATLEIAVVPFRVRLLNEDLGTLSLEVSYAQNREAAQANYTSLLHLGPLAQYFVRQDLTGRQLVLERDAGGQYLLSIT
jgi:hypothetical protein